LGLGGIYFVVDTAGNTIGSDTAHGMGLPIGFNFVYNDSTFSLFGVNSDGWISFGTDSVDMESNHPFLPINATSSAPSVLRNRVSALGDNLIGQTGSRLRYATLGSAPNRMLVVEWKNFRRNLSSLDTLSFQIILHETSNVVEFIYGKFSCGSAISNSEVGIRGKTNTDYLNRSTNDHWNLTSAGGSNAASCTLASYSYPDSSLTFIYTPPFHDDAGVTAITAPFSPLLATGTNKVAVTIKNFGTDTLVSDTIGWSVNGVLQTPFYWSGKLAYDSVSGHDTIGSYNFAAAGAYIIKSWTYFPNGTADENNSNDTVSTTIYVQGYASIPFVENFSGTWINFQGTRDVPSVYWLNTPVTGNDSWRREDDTTSASWTNGHIGAYSPAGANGTLHSARFHSGGATSGTSGTLDAHINFTTAGTKILNFWYHNTRGNDSLAIYLSSNGGASWQFQKRYFTTIGWTQYSLTLGTSTSANTILRFKATDDASDTTDIGIDNVQVYIQQPVSLAAVKWVSPLGETCGMTTTEPVTIKFANTGTLKVPPPIKLSYSINDAFSSITEIYSDTVPVGDTVSYTFVTTANFSSPGVYHCIFEAHKQGYPFVFNDTLSYFVNSLGDLSGNPFVDSLENGNGHYTFSNGTNSTVALDSLVGDQGTHGFYSIGGATGTWAGGPTTTTGSQAFSYGDHVTRISTCDVVDSSTFSANNLYLTIDLKQSFSTGSKYSYFMVLLNRAGGIDTLKDITGTEFFNPVTQNSDPFAHKIFNLSPYVDSVFNLEFVSSCKTGADSVRIDNVTLSAKPVINLGPDTISFCPGSTLNAGAAPVGYNYSYRWSTKFHPATLATTQTITADSSATYYVTVNNGFGVTATDSITVSLYGVPPDLIARYDTGCAPYLVLKAGVGLGTYLWSTGATTMSDTVIASGTYWVDVKNSNGCITRDSATVDIIPKATATTFSQSVCYLDTLDILNATAANYDSLLWSTTGDGHFTSTTQLHTKYKVGPTDIANQTVTLTLTAYSACNTKVSPMVVTITTAPSVSAGSNDTICRGNNVQLIATNGTTYKWSPSTGLSNSAIANPIADPTHTITYTVTGTSSCGTAAASVTVTVDTITATYIGADTTICANASITLNGGSGYNSYQWSTGSVAQTVIVDSATMHVGLGTLKVLVDVTKGACSIKDSINVSFSVCTGIDEYANNVTISIFPNPTTGMTNILVNGMNGNAVLNIYSMMGQSVFNKNINGNEKTELDLSRLSKGVYFVKITNEKAGILSKLIIQ
jgi:hypothetical protein